LKGKIDLVKVKLSKITHESVRSILTAGCITETSIQELMTIAELEITVAETKNLGEGSAKEGKQH
jgi:hypothetical protein